MDQDFADELTAAITQAMGGESSRYAANVELPSPARGGMISGVPVLRRSTIYKQAASSAVKRSNANIKANALCSMAAIDDNNKRVHEETAHARAMVGALLINCGASASAEH